MRAHLLFDPHFDHHPFSDYQHARRQRRYLALRPKALFQVINNSGDLGCSPDATLRLDDYVARLSRTLARCDGE